MSNSGADLLLELFSEEIPARMQADALAHLQKTLAEKLQKEGIQSGSSKGFVTPRRLTVWIKDLPVAQAASETEIKGPKVGAPDAAMQGFLKKSGLTKKDLTERDGVYFAVVKKAGQQTADILKKIIEQTLASFPWPKSMRWGSGDTTWVRPLHSMICIFDTKVVPVSFAGVHASHTTKGHRFLSDEPIIIADPAEYEEMLEKAFVIADREKRKASILAQAERAAAAQGLQLKKDDGLLEEVTGLVEYPVVLAGKIDAKFMDLPKEVLVSEMRAHQKYFALEKPRSGDRAALSSSHREGQETGAGDNYELSDTFLITANTKTNDGGKAIIAGNERVLRARLSDGRFFWDQDRKKKLDEWANGLKTVTFHAKLGTIADKVERIKKLAVTLMPYVDPGLRRDDVERAANLCKADLVTGMVGEFPELQGVMGRYYAIAQKENAAVADAIRDHYKPQGPTDSVPSEKVAVCVALADKLDTLVSMFAIGEKPTGSKDPFALRRSALGIIRIVLENNIRLPLSLVIPAKAGIQTPQQVRGDNDLLEFFHDRLKVQLKEQGIRHDVIDAVVANGDDDLVRIVERAKALQAFLGSDDGINLLAGYKRAVNILSIEEKKDNTTYKATFPLQKIQGNKVVFSISDDEQNLLNVLEEVYPSVQAHLKIEKYKEALLDSAKLRKSVDMFFDKVRINDDNPETRIARLKMLSSLRGLFDEIADLSKIEGDVKEQKRAA